MFITLSGALVTLMSFVLLWKPVLAVGMTLALVTGSYIMVKPSYARAFHLMILTLPLLTAFVIDIGGNLRVPYYFAVIALILGLYQGQLRIPKPSLALWALLAFIIYSFLSVALTLQFQQPLDVEVFGFRTSQFRPLIQAGQLGLMLVFFYLTYNFLRSRERLHLVSTLIFWSLALVILYATYEIACSLSDCSFFNINTNPDHISNRFAGSQTINSDGIQIPRPRSTLLEPLNLGIFILFSLPFAVAYLSYAKGGITRWIAWGVIALSGMIFTLTWSRGAFVGMIVVIPLVFLLLPSIRARLMILAGGVAAYLAVGLILFPLLGGKADVLSPAVRIYERLYAVAALPTSIISGKPIPIQLGRSYDVPIEIFRNHAVFGVGLGNYPIAYSELNNSPLSTASPFSLHLEILTQLGLIGATFFYTFLGMILYRLCQTLRHYKSNPLRPLALASLVSIVGVMTSQAALGGLTTQSHLWVMLAIGLAIPEIIAHAGKPNSALGDSPEHVGSIR